MRYEIMMSEDRGHGLFPSFNLFYKSACSIFDYLFL